VTATAHLPELDLREPLRRLFGFDGFLPGQEEVVRSALAGRDTLALMPTGSGKSLPYQLAAMLRDSPTLVVSPLIALMKDQVDKLPPGVAAQASVINSSLEQGESARRLAAFAGGGVKLLLAAPERLRQRGFVTALATAEVGLVVVDEVHCVTMWGHDFRPDYLFIRAALAELGEPPVLGLTATATPETEAEIGRALGREFAVVRASVVRPNLRHLVDAVETEEDRRRQLLERLREAHGPSIVYARSRKKCEELSRLLRGHGVRAEHYHAGLEASERTRVQEAFVGDEVPVVVATTAFGMGIDKPDIRLVLLYNLPGSLEDYVQMVGRAGRDGDPSRCVLFTGRRDAGDLRRFAQADVPAADDLRVLYRRLRDAATGGVARLSADELGEERDPRVLVGMLEQAGLVRRGFDAGRALQVELLPPPGDAPARIADLLARAEQQALARAARIIRYGDSSRCRQVEIAEHFGEAGVERCGVCDRCDPPRAVGVVAFEEDAAPAPALPDDVAGTILRAAADLRWPLGVGGLVAMFSGSVSAPPSARRSPAFGALAAATPTAIRRWIGLLVASGHLERYESEDGYPLLRVVRTDDPPQIAAAAAPPADVAPEDEGLFERLRAWRRETAAAASVPAYVVLADKTLRAIAAAKPATEAQLADVPGIGPAKLERYGPALLRLLEVGRE
jgi:ATP-dependent DNA helicase RecQ